MTNNKKQKTIYAQTREEFFSNEEKKGLLSIDMGTKSKLVDTRKIIFIASVMENQEEKFFNIQTLQKALNQRIKDAKKSCLNKPKKDCDPSDLYYLSLIGKGRVKSGGIVGKIEVNQARKFLYFQRKILINATLDKNGNINFQKIDFIPNLIELVDVK